MTFQGPQFCKSMCRLQDIESMVSSRSITDIQLKKNNLNDVWKAAQVFESASMRLEYECCDAYAHEEVQKVMFNGKRVKGCVECER